VRHLRLMTTISLMLLLFARPVRAADPPDARKADPKKPAESAEATDPGPDAKPGQADDPDLDVNKAQPDFALSALPTTLRLPKHKMAFRLTHRFTTPLEDSGIGNLFGMDDGALIGLELRYGLFSGAQVGFYRTSDRTIEFFTQYDIRQQGKGLPFGLAAYASVEGTNNFQDSYSPGLGAVISREVGTRLAVYAEPFWVNNSNPEPADIVDHNSTSFFGLGARVRVLQATYLTFEVAPRMSGYGPGSTHAAIGIEKRAGGHLFQLTFANTPGTTLANVARGGPNGNDWYLGFNLSRKFY
jgi:hypothetical protein